MTDEAVVRPKNPLAEEVHNQFRAAYYDKERLGLHKQWAKNEDYWAGKQNPKKSDVHPGSVTNIIMPTIESMISDLVMEPLEITLEGWSIADRAAAPKAQKALEWVWQKNDMITKRDRFERFRLKFGTGIWKVYFDGQGRGLVGMPIVEPVNPTNFFVDPKVTRHDQLHMADFVIHAVPRSIKYLQRVYGNVANGLEPDPNPALDPSTFGESDTGITKIGRDKVLLLERWTIEKGGKLRKVVIAGDVTLYDSDKDTEGERDKKGFYRLNTYPFVVVPCYVQEGMLWGKSEIDFLIPTQDLVNDLDDQIRMNARLMGNIQKVISVSSGINPKLWTNEAGINVPARDINGFKVVQPPPIPAYISQRRSEALQYEAQLISGRSDVVEGRRAGQLRAASAIIAMQERGLRRVNHKQVMSQQGLSQLFTIILDYIAEYWTEEVEIGSEVTELEDGTIEEKPITFRNTDLEIKLLTSDEEGNPQTRRADFDVTVNVGAGFVNNKSFIYQATVELVQGGIITPVEARAVLKQILGWPIIDPYQPEGEFAQIQQPQQGMNEEQMMQEQMAMQLEVPPEAGGIPPELMMMLAQGGDMPIG